MSRRLRRPEGLTPTTPGRRLYIGAPLAVADGRGPIEPPTPGMLLPVAAGREQALEIGVTWAAQHRRDHGGPADVALVSLHVPDTTVTQVVDDLGVYAVARVEASWRGRTVRHRGIAILDNLVALEQLAEHWARLSAQLRALAAVEASTAAHDQHDETAPELAVGRPPAGAHGAPVRQTPAGEGVASGRGGNPRRHEV